MYVHSTCLNTWVKKNLIKSPQWCNGLSGGLIFYSERSRDQDLPVSDFKNACEIARLYAIYRLIEYPNVKWVSMKQCLQTIHTG